jgi:hypothetical protein
MHRFRLLSFYVGGIVVVVGLTIGGVSMRRTADDHGARESSGKGTVAPTTVSAESNSLSLRARRHPEWATARDRRHRRGSASFGCNGGRGGEQWNGAASVGTSKELGPMADFPSTRVRQLPRQ